MWHREADGTFVTEISEFSRNPVHPVTREVLSAGEVLTRLVPRIDGDELSWWYGTLADGTRVLIYND